ncbi:Divergent AAA domain [uncultured Clostridium sp.]|uniref:Putative DNA binding domain-containing protein n=1 Tax=Flintibacter hominis TaxID=2763048 RepID=A0A8J6JAV6_9FIRM|nr:RNA-binding domain-containing protein [Flintibacter hominis]MBC5723148.1 putative DNA binding domain-containing protein [Flintibacter hominis]SCH17970.1 Divergent AAA domain [uncultured Clostridium sp.]
MAFVESEAVELKAEVVGYICKEVIAFANTKGGTLYIGVSNDGSVVGVKNTDQVMLQLNNMIRDSIKPDVTMFVGYETQHVNDKDIIAVTIQKGTDRPYYLSSKGLKPSGVYVRNGTSSDPATDTAIRRMIKETDGDSFESMRSLEQNLSFETAGKQFEKQHIPFDAAKMQTLGMISTDGIYSNAALLLSDQCPSTIKAATFSGEDKGTFQDRREFGGSLFQQMEELYSYLDMRNQTKATFDGLYRIDTRDYPEDALREALLNSLVHRDYSFRASTLVSVYADRIEFVSVGGLPSGIALDDIMLGLSVCRNPKLAAIFYRLQLIEAYGTGMPKIMNAYAETKLKPKIEVSSNAFKITLPNRNAGANHAETLGGTVKGDEQRILDFIGSHGHIVRSDVDWLLDVSQATANRILKRMVAEGLIYQDGNGRKTKYRRK